MAWLNYCPIEACHAFLDPRQHGYVPGKKGNQGQGSVHPISGRRGNKVNMLTPLHGHEGSCAFAHHNPHMEVIVTLPPTPTTPHTGRLPQRGLRKP